MDDCPGCGAEDARRTRWDGARLGWFCECMYCGWRTPLHRIAAVAMEDWRDGIMNHEGVDT